MPAQPPAYNTVATPPGSGGGRAPAINAQHAASQIPPRARSPREHYAANGATASTFKKSHPPTPPTQITVTSPTSTAAQAAASQQQSSSTSRQPPPPPPSSHPKKDEETYKALYDFTGQTASEMPHFTKDDILVILKKEGTGWWLARHQGESSKSGWVPESYIAPYTPPAPAAAARAVPPPPPPGGAANGRVNGAAKGKPVPPAPPSKRPAVKKPAAPENPRDSGLGVSGTSTPRESGGSIAGGLAEALKARQAAMAGTKDDEDDW